MSRSGYSDELENWALIRWRGAVNSAINGKRGQKFFRELVKALDAMPKKRLIAGDFEVDGDFCALGVLGHAHGIDLAAVDPEDSDTVAGKFNIAPALVKETVFMNDDDFFIYNDPKTPEKRWRAMRSWAANQIRHD